MFRQPGAFQFGTSDQRSKTVGSPIWRYFNLPEFEAGLPPKTLQKRKRTDSMFGFMKPVCRTDRYRKLYCDSCRFLRKSSGLLSTRFLSYEAVLVHTMAFDAGYISPEETVSPCRVLPMPQPVYLTILITRLSYRCLARHGPEGTLPDQRLWKLWP